jgi:hypothetical protein
MGREVGGGGKKGYRGREKEIKCEGAGAGIRCTAGVRKGLDVQQGGMRCTAVEGQG